MRQAKAQREAMVWPGRRSLLLPVMLLAIAIGLALSIGAIFATLSGPLMIACCVLWALTAGLAGMRIRRWWWVIGCSGVMLGFVLLWELVYGRESWRSLYVMMLGVVYALSAVAGAVPGVWLGRRRTTSSGRGQDRPHMRA